jgi:hypothetical protein
VNLIIDLNLYIIHNKNYAKIITRPCERKKEGRKEGRKDGIKTK